MKTPSQSGCTVQQPSVKPMKGIRPDRPRRCTKRLLRKCGFMEGRKGRRHDMEWGSSAAADFKRSLTGFTRSAAVRRGDALRSQIIRRVDIVMNAGVIGQHLH